MKEFVGGCKQIPTALGYRLRNHLVPYFIHVCRKRVTFTLTDQWFMF